jgi:hypothetical protein
VCERGKNVRRVGLGVVPAMSYIRTTICLKHYAKFTAILLLKIALIGL